MREVVIVLCDLYWLPGSEGGPSPATALPGLEQIARFADQSTLVDGWRTWLSQHFRLAPVAAHPDTSKSVWMATPVYLITGLTSLHLDRRSVLRLTQQEVAQLASEFRELFADSGFELEPLDSGELVLFGPALSHAGRPEPLRSLGESVADTLSAGTEPLPLRKLSAEVEMWLHNHPLNDARTGRGELPISSLWFWGGGATEVAAIAAFPAPANSTASNAQDIAFGSDAYLRGLWRRMGAKALLLPQQLEEIFGYSARRVVLVLEIGPLLHSNPQWSLHEAMADIDRRFLAPAVQALQQGRFAELHLLANDRHLIRRAPHRFRFWRPARPGLSGLK